MAFCNKIKQVMLIGILSSLVTEHIIAGPRVIFASPLGEEKWHMSGNKLRCGLSLVIPNYGIGYFEQYATQTPHFILHKWQQVERSLPAEIIVRPPMWKPLTRSFLVGRSYIRPGEYGIYLAREGALKLLTYLSLGYQATFNYLSEEGFSTTVSLSPVKFQEVYSRYQQCLGSLLPFSYEDVKESVFHFDVDSTLLAEEDKAQLRRVAQYAAADLQIKTIRVVGYADDSGRKGYNNAISEYRAEAVKEYLLSLGVPKRKLDVTWYGALKPIGRNDTDAGRAANRRVVIDMLKK